jgi:hypothetical protein
MTIRSSSSGEEGLVETFDRKGETLLASWSLNDVTTETGIDVGMCLEGKPYNPEL